jgi:hypothetical protein
MPPCSPYLKPLDSYFLEKLKQVMYSVRIRNIQYLKQRIREAATSVTADVLGRVHQEMECVFNICRATYGRRYLNLFLI